MKWFGNKKKIDHSDLIDLERTAAGDIDQCLRDWGRNAYKIFIAGEKEIKSLKDICAKEGIDKPLEMGAEQLRGIWRKYILDKAFSGEKGNVMISHFEEMMHQGGYLYMLQAACFDVGLASDIMISSDNVDHQITLFVNNGQIGITETLQVRQYNYLNRPDIVVGDGSYPLMVAMGEYSLGFDEMSPRCEVIKVILDFKEDFSSSLFEGNKIQLKKNLSPDPRI